MSKSKRIFIFSPKLTPNELTIRCPKYLREITFEGKSIGCNAFSRLRKLKLCKKIHKLETQFTYDHGFKALYMQIMKWLAKMLHYFKSYEYSFTNMMYSPTKYNVNIYKNSSWYYFFQKNSIKNLTLYSIPPQKLPGPQEANKFLYKFKRHHKALRNMKDLVLEGHLLNPYSKKVIQYLTQEWQASKSSGTIEIKLWDHSTGNEFFSKDEILERRIYSLYFVNRCSDFAFIGKVVENSMNYINLAKLEWWCKFSNKDHAKPLHHLRSLENLRELRIRFELEGEMSQATGKLLAHLKLPKKINYLHFYLQGLRLKWIERQGDFCSIEEINEDRICAKFLREFQDLENLNTLWIALPDIKMEYSLFFISILQHVPKVNFLLTTMSSRNFDWKDSTKFSILELGFWLQNIPGLMRNLKSLSIEFPCIHLDKLPKQPRLLENLEVLSLSYRIQSKAKMTDLLEKLNPKTIRALFFGDSIIDTEEDFKMRFEKLGTLERLENVSCAFSMKKPITEPLYETMKGCILGLKSLSRLSIRFEKALIEKSEWINELTAIFRRNRKINMATITAKNGKVDFSR
jgi:hypothetical protein